MHKYNCKSTFESDYDSDTLLLLALGCSSSFSSFAAELTGGADTAGSFAFFFTTTPLSAFFFVAVAGSLGFAGAAAGAVTGVDFDMIGGGLFAALVRAATALITTSDHRETYFSRKLTHSRKFFTSSPSRCLRWRSSSSCRSRIESRKAISSSSRARN